MSTQERGLDITIEGGTESEQYLVGAIVSQALARSGFSAASHIVGEDRAVDPLYHRLIVPSLMQVIRENSPMFMNTPVIVSAYHKPSITKERRAIDRVMDRALFTATSRLEDEEVSHEVNKAWNDLTLEEKESLIAQA